MVDLKVSLIDGAYHDVDSSVLAFEIASRAALAKRCRRWIGAARPIMKVEVMTPEDCTGSISDDLKLRRGGSGSANARRRQRGQRHGTACQHVRLHNSLGP